MAGRGMVRHSSSWRAAQVALLVIAIVAAVLLAVLDDRAGARKPGAGAAPAGNTAALESGADSQP